MNHDPSDMQGDGATMTQSSRLSHLLLMIFSMVNKTVFENKQLVDSNTIVDHNRIYGRDKQLAAEARAFRDTWTANVPRSLTLRTKWHWKNAHSKSGR